MVTMKKEVVKMKKVFIYSGIIIFCFMIVSINYAIAKETKEEFQADQTAIKKQIKKNSEYIYWVTINGSPDLAPSLLDKLKYALAVKKSGYWPEDIDFSSHLLKIAKALNFLNYSSKKDPNLKIAYQGLKLIRKNIPKCSGFCTADEQHRQIIIDYYTDGNIIKNYLKKDEYKYWIDPRDIPNLLYKNEEAASIIWDFWSKWYIWRDFCRKGYDSRWKGYSWPRRVFKDNPITKFYLGEIIMWFSHLPCKSCLYDIREYYGYDKFDIDNDGDKEDITPEKLYKIIRKGKEKKAKEAALTLGKFGGKDALNYLETALLGRKIEVEVGYATITKKVPPIPNSSVKLAVAESLLSLGTEGICVLLRALEKGNLATRRIVLKALKKANIPLTLIPLLRNYLSISDYDEKKAYQETIASIFRNASQAGFKKDAFITAVGMLSEAIGITESDNLQEKFIELVNKIGPFGGKLQIRDSLIEVIENDKHMENVLSAYVALSSIRADKHILKVGFQRYKDLYNSNLSEMTWKGKYENVKTIGTGWIEPWKETKLEEINKELEKIRQTWDVESLEELKDLLRDTYKEEKKKLLRSDIRRYKTYKEEKELVKLKAKIYSICYGALEGLSHVEIDKKEQYKKLDQAVALFVESTRDPKAIPLLKKIVLEILREKSWTGYDPRWLVTTAAIKALGSIATKSATKSAIDALDEILNELEENRGYYMLAPIITKTLLSTLGSINMSIIPKHYLGIECEKTKKWKETIEYAKEKFFKWVEKARKFFNTPEKIKKYSTKKKSNIYRWYYKYEIHVYPEDYLDLDAYDWNKIIKNCGYEDKTIDFSSYEKRRRRCDFNYIRPYYRVTIEERREWDLNATYRELLLDKIQQRILDKKIKFRIGPSCSNFDLIEDIWLKNEIESYFKKVKQEKVNNSGVKFLKNIYKLYQGKGEFFNNIPKDTVEFFNNFESPPQVLEEALWSLARRKANVKAFEVLLPMIERDPWGLWGLVNFDVTPFKIAEKIYKNPNINNIKELFKNKHMRDLLKNNIQLAVFYSKLLNKKVKNVVKVLKEAAESLASSNKNVVLSQFTPILQVLGGEKLNTLKSEVVNKEFPVPVRINASMGLIATLVRKNKSEQPNLANEISSILFDVFKNPKIREGLTKKEKLEKKIRLCKGITTPLAYLFNYCKKIGIKLKKKKDFIMTLKNMFKKNTIPNVRNLSLYLMENLMEDKELLNFMESIDVHSLEGKDKYYFIALRNILLKHPKWINYSNIRPAVEAFRGASWSEKANSKTDIINSKEITQQFLYYYFFGPIYSLNKPYSDKLLDALYKCKANEIQDFLKKQEPYHIPQGGEIVLYTNSSLPGQQKSTSTSSVSEENYYNNKSFLNIEEFNNYKPFRIEVEEQKENNGIFF